MVDRFRDLAASYGGTAAWIVEQQRLDRLAFSGADLVERVSRGSLAGGWEEFLRPDPTEYLGIHGELATSTRLVADMDRAGLASLGDMDLAARFGGNLIHELTSDPFHSAFDELCIAAGSRFEQECLRGAWIEHLLPTVDRLGDLAQSVMSEQAFDFTTERLLESIVGERDLNAIDALGRATSLRVRRGLYRDLGADRRLEHVPRPAIDAALRGEPQQEEHGESSLLIQLHLSHHPLSRDHTRCYELLGQLELFLRKHVARVMGEKYGAGWIESVPARKRSAWRRTFARRYGEHSALAPHLLSSSDFADLIELIQQEFDPEAVDLPALALCLEDVRMTRNAVMHFHAIVAADYVALHNNVVEILKALRLDTPDQTASGGKEALH